MFEDPVKVMFWTVIVLSAVAGAAQFVRNRRRHSQSEPPVKDAPPPAL